MARKAPRPSGSAFAVFTPDRGYTGPASGAEQRDVNDCLKNARRDGGRDAAHRRLDGAGPASRRWWTESCRRWTESRRRWWSKGGCSSAFRTAVGWSASRGRTAVVCEWSVAFRCVAFWSAAGLWLGARRRGRIAIVCLRRIARVRRVQRVQRWVSRRRRGGPHIASLLRWWSVRERAASQVLSAVLYVPPPH